MMRTSANTYEAQMTRKMLFYFILAVPSKTTTQLTFFSVDSQIRDSVNCDEILKSRRVML